MSVNGKIARTAGALYLIVVVTGIFSLMYVPSQIIVRGDALATANNIVTSESLFRLGIASWMINQMASLLLPFVLFKLLHEVGRDVAMLMVVLAVVSVPISLTSVTNSLDVLSLVSGREYLQAFTTEQLHAKVMLSLSSESNGMLAASIFWGLWLLPFGYLVFKSGFLPRILGILLMMGCFGILTGVFGRVLLPNYADSAISSLAELPSAFGEIGICLWLLIMGASEVKPMTTRKD